MKKIFFCLLAAFVFIGCNEKETNEDVVQEPNKDGSIETILAVTHADSFDVLTTTHKVWVKGHLEKTLVKTDTLSSLGMAMEEVEDKDGNAKNEMMRKDYEIFITVK